MAISKQRKDELMVQYTEWLGESDAIFIAAYAGIPVKELEALRGDVREAEGVFSITKNTLLRIALENNGKPVPTDMLNGQLATGFALGEAPTLAKALVAFAKDNKNFELRGGVMGDEILTKDQVEALAKLPSLDQLRAQLLGVISAPARDIAGTVASGVRQVINVLDAYSKKEEDDNGDAEPVAA